MKWKLIKNENDNPWVVWELDANQQPIPNAASRYWDKDTAINFAEMLVSQGCYVVVYGELAYCAAESE